MDAALFTGTTAADAAPAEGHVVISRFTVANGMAPQVREAFRARPHRVDDAAGFVGLWVMCPADRPEEFWLVTRWRDAESYQRWHRGDHYHASHAGIPKGLRLIGAETLIRGFDIVAG